MTRAKKNLVLIGDVNSLVRGISRLEDNRKTILIEKIRDSINPKVKVIDDSSSAFNTIGEIESDISPYDFIDSKNEMKQKNKNETIDDILNNIEESDIIQYNFIKSTNNNSAYENKHF